MFVCVCLVRVRASMQECALAELWRIEVNHVFFWIQDIIVVCPTRSFFSLQLHSSIKGFMVKFCEAMVRDEVLLVLLKRWRGVEKKIFKLVLSHCMHAYIYIYIYCVEKGSWALFIQVQHLSAVTYIVSVFSLCRLFPSNQNQHSQIQRRYK